MDRATRQPLLVERVQRLEAAFRDIQATRMRGIPLLNARLQVEAVGFVAETESRIAQGVLVTPWFMSLLRLPLHDDAADTLLAVGRSDVRELGGHGFDFLGAHEPAIGRYESSSLFSPMAEFVNHAAAVATAHSVLKLLRADSPPAQPARRGFLFGRSAVAGTRP